MLILFLNSLEPGTPGPFTLDLVRDHLHRDFTGASLASTRNASSVQRKELFHGHYQEYGWHLDNSQPGRLCRLNRTINCQAPLHNQYTPPDQMIGNLVINEVPREPQQPKERDSPDFQDVVTQWTEISAGTLAELRARQSQPAAPAANQEEPPVDPNFNWLGLVLPAQTNFQVPGDG